MPTKRTSVTLSAERQKTLISRMSCLGILGNAALTAFKLMAGAVAGSAAMMSDAVHSLTDVAGTGIALVGTRASRKEADSAHPYGHERFECIASLFIGLLLLITGIAMGWDGAADLLSGRAMTPPSGPMEIALACALISIAVKEGMYRYTLRTARELGSPAFEADAHHHRSDAFSSIGSAIGTAGAMVGVPALDSAAALIICAFIMRSSVQVLSGAVRQLTDTSGGTAFEERLRGFVEERGGNIRELRTRLFGAKVYVDLCLAVPGEMSVAEASRHARDMHCRIEETFADVKHVNVRCEAWDC